MDRDRQCDTPEELGEAVAAAARRLLAYNPSLIVRVVVAGVTVSYPQGETMPTSPVFIDMATPWCH